MRSNPRKSRRPTSGGMGTWLKSAEDFFYKNAGYSYDPKNETEEQGRRRAAKEYALAESWASAEGYTFEWDLYPGNWEDLFDYEDDIQAIRDGDLEVYDVVMLDPQGGVAASLGGVGFLKSQGTARMRADQRVHEAELALEKYAEEVRREIRPIGPTRDYRKGRR